MRLGKRRAVRLDPGITRRERLPKMQLCRNELTETELHQTKLRLGTRTRV